MVYASIPVNPGSARLSPGDVEQDAFTSGFTAAQWSASDFIVRVQNPGASEHASDCALHSEPAYPATPCDCEWVSKNAALAVLHFFGDPAGREPGGFVSALLNAMSAADLTNRARLVTAFPEYGKPFLMAKSARDGITHLHYLVETVAA
jgi:hypothetical protein